MTTTMNVSIQTRRAAGALLGILPHANPEQIRAALHAKAPTLTDIPNALEHAVATGDAHVDRFMAAARLLLAEPGQPGHMRLVSAYLLADHKVPEQDQHFPDPAPETTGRQMLLAVS